MKEVENSENYTKKKKNKIKICIDPTKHFATTNGRH